ncbi:copper transporter [Corynebacterium sp. 3HC-13]|uniref:copper transporter n=1 Tax=Corynebacterium poyangense TaxID=2684405 RepID=UPI001CCFC668|nr:copper transporter [Corynebacterium poyangense]MBZ8177720.1 copper transporter [Corynebacterium poyangense]
MAHNKGQGRSGFLIAGLGFGVAAGTLLGALVISPATAGLGDGGANKAQLAEAEDHAKIAEAQANSADSVVSELASDAVKGTLDGKPVLVIRTNDATDDDVNAINNLLKSSGAENAGTLKLTELFSSSNGADRLKSIVANTLPAGAQLNTKDLDPGTHAGDALGAALLLKPDSNDPIASDNDRKLLLEALKGEGFIDYQDGSIKPARAVVIVNGDSDGSGESSFASGMLSNFSRALAVQSKATVVAGRIHTASDSGVIGQLRGSNIKEISTVDSLDQDWARLATVLAINELLQGKHGNYGAAASADAAVPKLSKG